MTARLTHGWIAFLAIAIGIVLMLTGCADKRSVPQTAKVRAAGEVAKSRVRTATAKVQKLKVAVPEPLKADVQSVEDDLVEATAQLEVQTLAVDRLEQDISTLAAAAEKESAHKIRWRRFALWCASLLAVATLYIFRKPLLALL